MTIFGLFTWGVFVRMACSVWRMRALPRWRRGLPLVLLAASGASWVMAASLSYIGPVYWLSASLCPVMALASWGLSLYERRREGNAIRSRQCRPQVE